MCNLSWNGFGSRGGLALADALTQNEALTEIDVSGNRIDGETAEKIVKAASRNDLLQVIRVSAFKLRMLLHAYMYMFD